MFLYWSREKIEGAVFDLFSLLLEEFQKDCQKTGQFFSTSFQRNKEPSLNGSQLDDPIPYLTPAEAVPKKTIGIIKGML